MTPFQLIFFAWDREKICTSTGSNNDSISPNEPTDEGFVSPGTPEPADIDIPMWEAEVANYTSHEVQEGWNKANLELRELSRGEYGLSAVTEEYNQELSEPTVDLVDIEQQPKQQVGPRHCARFSTHGPSTTYSPKKSRPKKKRQLVGESSVKQAKTNLVNSL